MSKFAIKRHCVVCGAQFPEMSKEKLLELRCGTVRKDGGVTWHCAHHSEDQIEAALRGVPKFMNAVKKGNEV